LLQQEKFRKDILIPDVFMRMMQEGMTAAIPGAAPAGS